jgi:hypothetical protein
MMTMVMVLRIIVSTVMMNDYHLDHDATMLTPD